MAGIVAEESVFGQELRSTGCTSDVQQATSQASRYVRHYAMSMALDREGDGHEPALAQHYMERYLAGIERMVKRKGALQSAKTSVLGGHAGAVMGKPPLARLPHDERAVQGISSGGDGW